MSRKEIPATAEELHAALGCTSVLTVEECAWLLRSRPGDVSGVVNGIQSATLLLQDIQQDRELRYPSGYAGLYSYEE